MFRIVRPKEFTTTPWKNGGGVTHEVLRDKGADPWRWRISIAEVSTDGPFSTFAGLARVLTVIEGGGLDLHTPDGVLSARPFQPLAFSGDTPVDSRMVNGPVRDLNLIYDPTAVSASVEVTVGPARIENGPAQTGVFCHRGDVALDGAALPVGAFALGQGGTIILGPEARCVIVRMESV
ncbi:HutD family protein [uncultured Pseudosulfitobacter sp.]|jgi:environmental stress-induced protein Ves|uniref:HutD/Ves family protein n=1 Tax=uncultured Pseudosulfitobacter sp. TaxID=2854214 RepID=UPI0030DB48CA|tara:strand:- start:1495 stop:2031 length:537 start_codon:yes stop_codon:yes gene_type:complete